MREAMVQAIGRAARESGGKPVPAANLHVTLAFLGSVAGERLRVLGEVARAAARETASAAARRPAGAPESESESADSPEAPFELSFDHLEYWRGAQLLCASAADSPPWAAALAGRLKTRLAQSGFAPDLKAFRPHVTVVRKVVRPAPPGKMHAVIWGFTELALVESRTLPEGPLYSVVESYPLCAKGAE